MRGRLLLRSRLPVCFCVRTDNTVVDIVHEGKPPVVALKELMSRSAKPERR